MAISEERQNEILQSANRYCAIIMPLIEAGAVGYATYVLVVLLCIYYLLNPSSDLQAADIHPRKATAIALVIVYFVLLFIMAVSFFRLIQVMWINPGLIPFGESTEKVAASTKDFDCLDAFTCDYQGNPNWCERCCCYKPDRTHHASAIDRCVRRMDHFCPYAGGMISETTHKFFIQFLFYGSLYLCFVVVTLSVFSAEHVKYLHKLPATWIVALALAGFFFLFCFGMFVTSFYHIAINITTVESLNKDVATYNIALLRSPSDTATASPNALCEIQRTPSRSYIVLQTNPGERPWDLGTLANIKSIMGDSWIDWFLPLKMSPCTVHRGDVGHYEWGSVVEKMMRENDAGSSGRISRRPRRSRATRS
ncbi:hypothetical protein K469DRAFT_646569 [Zopfia rhizophila CBS 207.26]|uniref:Palmitoyltransferase n=1 Tax=Zopfia rhizophila CBS 207.26 TaxID=1314779 RepID=A0A6A6D9K4_9PEZI|nr:hypothetical protein K469DRAFT_646569 [Zopfia rhizophila CBS 207.26]